MECIVSTIYSSTILFNFSVLVLNAEYLITSQADIRYLLYI